MTLKGDNWWTDKEQQGLETFTIHEGDWAERISLTKCVTKGAKEDIFILPYITGYILDSKVITIDVQFCLTKYQLT